MAKIPAPIGNDFCPQTLFLYGTYKKDGTPNFGLFCWISYCCWGSEIGVMACIGLDKLTKDRTAKPAYFPPISSPRTAAARRLLRLQRWIYDRQNACPPHLCARERAARSDTDAKPRLDGA